MTLSSATTIHLKLLIPSLAAGGIIGKGGETIAEMQKKTGVRFKMSKANDYSPGEIETVKGIWIAVINLV